MITREISMLSKNVFFYQLALADKFEVFSGFKQAYYESIDFGLRKHKLSLRVLKLKYGKLVMCFLS
jgi:uncharacterized protein YjbK